MQGFWRQLGKYFAWLWQLQEVYRLERLAPQLLRSKEAACLYSRWSTGLTLSDVRQAVQKALPLRRLSFCRAMECLGAGRVSSTSMLVASKLGGYILLRGVRPAPVLPRDARPLQGVAVDEVLAFRLFAFLHFSLDFCFEDPRCMALKPEDKELGLPFWKGKCEVRSHRQIAVPRGSVWIHVACRGARQPAPGRGGRAPWQQVFNSHLEGICISFSF